MENENAEWQAPPPPEKIEREEPQMSEAAIQKGVQFAKSINAKVTGRIVVDLNP